LYKKLCSIIQQETQRLQTCRTQPMNIENGINPWKE